MVSVNTDNHSTAFTVSIDHVDTTTGISAYELFCHCHESSGRMTQSPEISGGGTYVPSAGREGGVLKRTGHTEATVDLMKLAGLKPCGVLRDHAWEDLYHDAHIRIAGICGGS